MINPRAQLSPLVPPGQVDFFHRDMTVTVAADVPLGTLQSKLADAGQWAAVDGDDRQPVGLLVQLNSTGSLRIGYGGWRDLLLGCQFTNRRGELITAGGRAMKNVAGYDLTKLMVGSQGQFGNLVTITLRTYRQPTAALLATAPIDVSLVNLLLTSSCRPKWILIAEGKLHCGYLDDVAAIEFQQTALPKLQNRCRWSSIDRHDLLGDAAIRARLWTAHQPGSDIEPGFNFFKASVPPARVGELFDLGSIDPCFGIIVGRVRQTEREYLQRRVDHAGGKTWFWTAAGEWTENEGTASNEVLQQVRAAFR